LGKRINFGLVAALSATLGLAGCSDLPSAGPSASAVVSAGGDSQLSRQFELVNIDASTIEVLGRRPRSSFAARFGDHRLSAEPVIGVGDVVTVTIWEASSGGLFSSPAALERLSAGANSATIPEQVVGRDGSISVPYAGRIVVAGKTTRAVQLVIQRALEGKAIQPQVLVNDTKPISNTVSIGGEGVGQAQRLPLSVKGDKLLEVIAQAGGVKLQVNEIYVVLQRGGVTERVPLARVTEDSRENIFMRPGDVVTLVRDPQTFMVSGAANGNAELPFSGDTLSLAQALSRIGGLSDYRADARGVFVFRYESPAVLHAIRPDSPLAHGQGRVPVVYRLNRQDPNSLFMEQRFQITSRDLIYISDAPTVELQKAVDIFNGIVAPITSTTATAASAAVTLK